MELRHLRYFVTLVEEMHFGKAAEKLHIVQPALSRQLIALEEEIGTVLLLRNSRNLALTKAGELFYQEAVHILKQTDNAVRLAKRAGRGLIGTVRIGFVGNASLSGVLPFYLNKYRQTYPDVEVLLQEMPIRALSQALLDNRLDLAFSVCFSFDISEKLVTRTLQSWPWVIGMAADHPLAKVDKLKAEQLRHEPFVLYGDKGVASDQIAILQGFFGHNPLITYQVTNTLSTLTLTAAGYGIALLPGALRNVKIPGILYKDLCDFIEPLPMNIFMRKDEKNPIVNALFDTVLHSKIELSYQK